MTLTITPAQLKGSVTPPPSKSQAHRLLIAAALAPGESVVENVALSQDISATLGGLEALGAQISREGDALRITGTAPCLGEDLPRLECGESGSTLRFLIPVALALRGGGVFTGRGRLMDRPQGPYRDLFREKGILWEQEDGVLTVRGELTPGGYALPGDVSSQFFTGLLYALSLLPGPSLLRPTTPLESGEYIALTLAAMERFGVRVPTSRSLPPQYSIPGGGGYRPTRAAVETDWSQAGFWYAARFLGGEVELRGLDLRSLQGDRVMDELFARLKGEGDVALDVSGCPDLVPPLAVMAALRRGRRTRLEKAGRLRLKESDRLRSVTAVLTALGGEVTQGEDFLVIQGRDLLPGGAAVDAFNDHRIAMMTAIAATRCEKPVTLTGAESVAKSYPDFWEEYQRLGGKLQEAV